MARLLVATTAQGAEILEELLAPHHELIFVNTIEQAMLEAQEKHVDAILCGMLFDESRMFDFLRLQKATPAVAKIAFICSRITVSDLPKAIIDGLETASRALGACMFLDVFALLEKNEGDKVIEFVDSCLPKELRTDAHSKLRSKKHRSARA